MLADIDAEFTKVKLAVFFLLKIQKRNVDKMKILSF